MTFTRATWIDNVTPPGIDATNLNRIEQGIVDAQALQAPVPIKQAKVATTANITLSGTQTIDGVSVTAGNRVLVKDQTTGSQNGIYDVAAGAWSRSSDASSSTTLIAGTLVVTEQGTVNGDMIWMLTTNSPLTVGTTALTFARPAFPSADASAILKGSVFTSVTPSVSTSPTAVSINDPLLETRIEGLGLQWDSTTGITVKSGAAWVPSLNRVLNVPSDIVKTGLATTANTWFYVYLWLNGSNPDVEVSTTAPSAPYKGTAARTKTGDTSRRYIGEIRTNAAGTAIFKFITIGGAGWETVSYLENVNASPFLVLSSGLATTETNVSCTSVVPATTQFATINFSDLSGVGIGAYIGNADDNITLSSSVYLLFVGATSSSGADVGSDTTTLPLSSVQSFSYLWASAPSAGNGLYARVTGYTRTR